MILTLFCPAVKECDRLSLVTYDSIVSVPFELMQMTEENKKSAMSFVERIQAGTSTNLSGGLFKGLCIGIRSLTEVLD